MNANHLLHSATMQSNCIKQSQGLSWKERMVKRNLIPLVGAAAFAAMAPTAAFAQSSWSISIGSGGGYYDTPYYSSHSRHDDEHEELDAEHGDVHDQLDEEHAEAHEQGLTPWEHAQLHRQLRYEHRYAHDQLDREHDGWHRREWQRRYYPRYSYYGYYGY